MHCLVRAAYAAAFLLALPSPFASLAGAQATTPPPASPPSRSGSAGADSVRHGAAHVAPADSPQSPPRHDDDHDEHEGHLHFSHPLVTESPSPDTKLRLDYLWTRTGSSSADRATEHGVRVEGEYAFSHALSLAVTVPYAWLSAAGVPDASHLGNTEVSLKAASLRWGDRGLLVGGGLSAGLPTGSDARGIGTSRAAELEPFVDVGVKRGGLELVGFGHYGTTVRNRDGVDAEREIAFDGSALYAVTHDVEALVEVGAARTTAGPEGRTTATSLAPGLKLYPFANRCLMFGISAPLGLSGKARDERGLLVSAFYHF